MRLLGRWPFVKIETIEISSLGRSIAVDGRLLSQWHCVDFARRDGFESFAEMMLYWKGQLPFEGQIIHWDFSQRIEG